MFVRVARAFVASTDLLITGPCTIPVILRGAIKNGIKYYEITSGWVIRFVTRSGGSDATGRRCCAPRRVHEPAFAMVNYYRDEF